MCLSPLRIPGPNLTNGPFGKEMSLQLCMLGFRLDIMPLASSKEGKSNGL